MNVLWICTDQQRFDTLGCMGNPWVYTPNLDRLAAEGVLFENTYAQSPVCAPSRGCFLSGRYPRTCGPRQNGQDIGKDEKLVPKMFADHGYYCGLSGKLHLSACHPDTGRMIEPRIDDGYHEFHWSHHPQSWKDVNNWPANEYSQFLMENCVDYVTQNREDCKYVQVGVDEKWHQTTWCADQAIAFMEKCKTRKKSWLFSFNCFDPHHAFDPPAEYLERYLKILDQIPLPNYEPGELENKTVFQQKDHVGADNTPGQMPDDVMTVYDHRMITAAYWAMVDLIDKQVGRMLDYLEQSGQKEDTLVIFHSDHGENLGDHGMYLKGPYFYENNVHVPLIISWPGKIPGGRKSKALIELADLAPTICEAAGLPLYEGFQGKSFWKILTGESDLNTHRDSVYREFYNSNINHRNPLAFTTIVCDGRYKLTKVHGCTQGAEGELYDLQEKPLERYNHYNNPAFTEIKVRMLELRQSGWRKPAIRCRRGKRAGEDVNISEPGTAHSQTCTKQKGGAYDRQRITDRADTSCRGRTVRSAQKIFMGKKKWWYGDRGNREKPARELGLGWKISPSVDIPGKGKLTLAEIEGSGIIQHIWLTCPHEDWRSFILRMYWDGEEVPSIEVPLADFFCMGGCGRG